MGPQPEREGELRNRSHLDVGGQPDDRGVGLPFEAARRDPARPEAIDSERAAIARRAERVEALPQLDLAGEMPGRLGRREIEANVARDRVEGWLQGLPALRAGMIGAVAAVLLGTLANDSGGIVLVS